VVTTGNVLVDAQATLENGGDEPDSPAGDEGMPNPEEAVGSRQTQTATDANLPSLNIGQPPEATGGDAAAHPQSNAGVQSIGMRRKSD
jgi:hypothetical protein